MAGTKESEAMSSENGQNAPITRREGDRIWKTVDELKKEVVDRHDDVRENFRLVFNKLDKVRKEFSRCPIYAKTLNDVEERVGELEGECSKMKVEVYGNQQNRFSKGLGVFTQTVTVCAVLIGGVWFLITKVAQ
jgi:hypothetical protein